MSEKSNIGYSVLSKTDDVVKISCFDTGNVKQVVTIPASTWSTAKKGIDLGLDAWEILSSYVETKASSAKAISAEAAEKAELAAKIKAAIDRFISKVKVHTWSSNVNALATAYDEATRVARDAADAPMPILDLNIIRRIEGKLASSDTEVWSYVKATRQGGFYLYEIKTKAPPDFAAQVALDNAKATFQIAAHDEVCDLAEPILNSEIKVTKFDLDDEGKIFYNANIKVSSGNAGNRTRGPWLYTDKNGKYPAYNGKVFRTVGVFCIEVGLSTSDSAYPHAPGKSYREDSSLTKTELPVDYS